MEKKENIIKKLQGDSRVERRRALQILAVEDEFPNINPHSYPTHFRCKIYPVKKSQSVGNREDQGSETWKQTCYHKFQQRVRIYHRNLHRKKEQISAYYKIIFFPQYKERVEVEIFVCDIITKAKVISTSTTITSLILTTTAQI